MLHPAGRRESGNSMSRLVSHLRRWLIGILVASSLFVVWSTWLALSVSSREDQIEVNIGLLRGLSSIGTLLREADRYPATPDQWTALQASYRKTAGAMAMTMRKPMRRRRLFSSCRLTAQRSYPRRKILDEQTRRAGIDSASRERPICSGLMDWPPLPPPIGSTLPTNSTRQPGRSP